MEHLQAITRRFSDALNKGLKNTLGEIPTAARLADQFNLRAYGTKTISRETARKWKCGLALPEAGNLQVLIEWLNLSSESVFSSGPLDLDTHLKLLYSATELVRASHKLRESEHLAQAALNALSPRTAVLDETGVIILVNNAWRAHAVADLDENFYKSCCEGVNYLHVCDHALGRESGYAAKMAVGIRAVMRHERIDYALKYPYYGIGTKHWYIGKVFSFAENNAVCTVITHEAITEIVQPSKPSQ